MLPYLLSPKAGALVYNVCHSYVLSVALACAALIAHRRELAGMSSIWTAHIGLDRTLRYGLKYPFAFAGTHLGPLGRNNPASIAVDRKGR